MLRSTLSHLQDHEVLELLPLNLLYTFDVVLVHDEALEFRKIAEALHLRPRGELAAGDVEEAEAREAGGLEGGGRGGGEDVGEVVGGDVELFEVGEDGGEAAEGSPAGYVGGV